MILRITSRVIIALNFKDNLLKTLTIDKQCYRHYHRWNESGIMANFKIRDKAGRGKIMPVKNSDPEKKNSNLNADIEAEGLRYRELMFKLSQHDNEDSRNSDVAKYIYIPLLFISETFRLIVSYTVGLEFLLKPFLKFEKKFLAKLRRTKLKLPTPSVHANNGFEIFFEQRSITRVNFLFQLISYIIRVIARSLGIVIGSLFVFPVFGIVKIVRVIQGIRIKYQISNCVKKCCGLLSKKTGKPISSEENFISEIEDHFNYVCMNKSLQELIYFKNHRQFRMVNEQDLKYYRETRSNPSDQNIALERFRIMFNKIEAIYDFRGISPTYMLIVEISRLELETSSIEEYNTKVLDVIFKAFEDYCIRYSFEKEALDCFTSISTNNAFKCGQRYLSLGMHSKALEYFLQVPPDFENYQDALINCAHLYKLDRKFDLALAYFKKAKDLNTENTDAGDSKSLCLREDDITVEIEFVELLSKNENILRTSELPSVTKSHSTIFSPTREVSPEEYRKIEHEKKRRTPRKSAIDN